MLNSPSKRSDPTAPMQLGAHSVSSSMGLPSSEDEGIKISVVSDQSFVNQLLSNLLNSQTDMDVVGHARQGLEAYDMIVKTLPNMLLVSMEHPLLLGIPITEIIRKLNLKCKIAYFNCSPNSDFWPDLLTSGAKGFFKRGANPEEMRVGIRILMQGGSYISQGLISPSSTVDYEPIQFRQPPQTEEEALTLDSISEPINLPAPKRNWWKSILKLGSFAFISLAAISVLGYLTYKVVSPTFSDPSSKAYDSSLGYPAQQRLKGLPIDVTVVPVEEKVINDSTSAEGETVALEVIDVPSINTGIVASVNFAEGDRVQQGQTLVTLKNEVFQDGVNIAKRQIAIAQRKLLSLKQSQANLERPLQSQISNAKHRITMAQAQLQKMRSLEAKGVIAKNQVLEQQDILAQRETELISAKQALAAAKKEYTTEIGENQLVISENQAVLQQAQRTAENIVIKSPASGLVSYKTVNIGELVSPEKSLLTISKDIVLKVDVDQTQIQKIKRGDPVTLRFVTFPGRTFSGNVFRINPTVSTGDNIQSREDKQTQYTYPLWVKVNGLKLTPGLQGVAQFDRKFYTNLVPESSVTHVSGGEGMVLVAQDNQAVVKKVQLGKIIGNQREILSGLSTGETVLSAPSAIEPGDQLNPIIESTTTEEETY